MGKSLIVTFLLAVINFHPSGLQAGLFWPDVPVRVVFREAKLGSSKVGQFTNLTDSYMQVVIILKDAAGDEIKRDFVSIPAAQTVELGWVEGWKFVTGQTVTLQHRNFSAKKVIVP